jgi:hypothetical protein
MNPDLCFKFSISDWKALSMKLERDDESAWRSAIDVFERRMNERFFSCLDALEAADTKPDLDSERSEENPICIPGFAIMALCCLLIETLQEFREGSITSTEPRGPCSFPQGPCIQSVSGTNKRFKEFLARPAFSGSFSSSVANRFNDGIRNGILHNAETRKWVIWRDEPKDSILGIEDQCLALNRTLFYQALKQEFRGYLTELRDPRNRELRGKFKLKMDRLSQKS